jgi:hypothetical protein
MDFKLPALSLGKTPSFNLSMLRKFLPSLSNKFVLTIGDDGAILVYFSGGKVKNAWFVPADAPEGPDGVTPFLALNKRAPVLILVDMLEQMYREENLPPVNFIDRPRVLDRRLDLAFPNEKIKAAMPLGLKDPATRNQKYLLAALPITDLVTRWQKYLVDVPNPIVGFCLLPLESYDMIPLLVANPGDNKVPGRKWRAIISLDVAGGFRQIVTVDAQMALTRMTVAPPPDSDTNESAVMIDRELRSTIGYIKRLGYIEGNSLDLVIITSDEIRAHLRTRQLAATTVTLLTPQEAANKLGLPKVSESSTPYGDVLHAAWFAQKWEPRLKLTPREVSQSRAITAAKKLLPIGAAALTLGTIGYAGSVGLSIYEQDEISDRRRREYADIDRKLKNELADLGRLPLPADEMRASIAIWENLPKRTLKLDSILQGLNQALAPDMHASAISMAYTAQKTGVVAQVARLGGRPQPQQAQQAANKPAEQPYEVKLVVEFPAVKDNREKAVVTANELTAKLIETFPSQKITVIKLPVDILPGQVLSGGVSQSGGPAKNVRERFSAEYLIGTEGK